LILTRPGIELTVRMTTTSAPAVPRRRTRLLGAAAVTALCLGGLSACGDGEKLAAAEKAGKTVGNAVRAQSEKAGTDITTAISTEPWKGKSNAYVTGRYDYLVVNVPSGACAKLVFDDDKPGSDYKIAKTYSCG
jgi:hypothetical protein